MRGADSTNRNYDGEVLIKQNPPKRVCFFALLVSAFQQVKAVSARRESAGSTLSTTRKSNAAITALTPLKLHHTAHTAHTTHIRHCRAVFFRQFSNHAVSCQHQASY